VLDHAVAGPLTLAIDGTDLRYVAFEGHELLRRAYVGVRDLNWDTVEGRVTRRDLDVGDNAFRLSMEIEYQQRDLAFTAAVQAIGRADGTLEYVLSGRASSSFEFAKIGLCLHHPIAGLAGQPFTGLTPWGPVGGRLPDHIGPQIQLTTEQWHLPLFLPVSELSLEHTAGTLHFAFEGDLFEMEDQRNWSDQSYKTSSTPAYLGYRHALSESQEVHQRVTVSFEPSPRPPRVAGRGNAESPEQVRLQLGALTGRLIPPIGLTHAGRLSSQASQLLSAMGPSHLRLEVDLREPTWAERLEGELVDCRAVGASVELALFLAGDPREVLGVVNDTLRAASVPVTRVLVFRRDEEVTNPEWPRLVRHHLPLTAPIGGGTNLYFNELNRSLPDLRPFDVLAYSTNPQIHAFDDRSLVENLEGQAEQVASARAFGGDRHLAVSPITLRPRFNAVAQTAIPQPAPGALPSNVDARQPTLFAAAWTLGSVMNLVAAGADSLTYYETVGPRGVLEPDGGSNLPQELFASSPGMAFPLYHVLADAAGLVGSPVVACRAEKASWLAALAVRTPAGFVLLLANLCPSERAIRIELAGRASVRFRVLNDSTFEQAGSDPSTFRAVTQDLPPAPGPTQLTLSPYATARLELS
jgi:hypothetical protein